MPTPPWHTTSRVPCIVLMHGEVPWSSAGFGYSESWLFHSGSTWDNSSPVVFRFQFGGLEFITLEAASLNSVVFSITSICNPCNPVHPTRLLHGGWEEKWSDSIKTCNTVCDPALNSEEGVLEAIKKNYVTALYTIKCQFQLPYSFPEYFSFGLVLFGNNILSKALIWFSWGGATEVGSPPLYCWSVL